MKKLLITTTESLHGWEIEAYLKPVFASVVIGTNFFADFGASIADLFGGRSTGYEKRLQLIKDNAIEILSDKASKLGANCILGLKVDMDEISGKNMQMFMVTAFGMAVVARSAKTNTETKYLKEIDKDFVKDRANIIRLAKKFNNKEIVITEDEIKILIESRSADFKEYLLDRMKLLTYNYSGVNESVKLIKEYFSVINPDDSISVLYPALLTETNAEVIKQIVEIIKDNDLLDFAQISKMLNGTKEQQKLALNLCLVHKPSYIHEDLKTIKALIEAIKDKFPKLSTMTTKKGFLSSTEKEVWTCKCNSTNGLDVRYCSTCGQDEYGFKAEDLKATQVIDVLTYRITALEEMLQ